MHKEAEDLVIDYRGRMVSVTPHARGTDTYFTIHLAGSEIVVNLEYVDGNACWMENGVLTERSEELGRLIEEWDNR